MSRHGESPHLIGFTMAPNGMTRRAASILLQGQTFLRTAYGPDASERQ